MADNKLIHIIGGGTVAHIRNHLALTAPAYGSTARDLVRICNQHPDNKLDVELHLTKMASRFSHLETNEDISKLVDELVERSDTKIIFFNPALVDFEPYSITTQADFHEPESSLTSEILGKYEKRLKTSVTERLTIRATPAEKILGRIRKTRKDIFLVAFKTTCGVTEQEQYLAGLNLLKANSCNLVLANDTKTRVNMIITPEEARYHVTTNREEALVNLVDMALLRSHLSFTRSTVVDGEAVSWHSDLVPESLRTVVNAMIDGGAYKPFRGATVGHFATKLSDDTFLTSKRKTNFNDIDKNGLVLVKTDGPDNVIAYGAKPSVGGQSQRIIFKQLPGFDCIVHFHCPLKENAAHDIPIRSQREFECGSHACGSNTANGLQAFDVGALASPVVVYAVHLDQHGPNIVFPKDIDPQLVINFIKENWDLDKKTGGYVS